ncbi:E1-E2 ATPase-domain-containing protein [Thelephora terrestris]|uniref:E1-E2 ATPase-domain-containing protein n=1 Tax=Thelephora terrestris TaxID=56493 RepID=A0A9P6L4H9_9AGAM|nr:E1-E2 ATPase-domain-containing protein [Thelephora terrestris]
MWIASSWTARGHSLTVGFIEAGESPVREKSLAGKTAERKEARRWDEEASFRDTECRYEPWERVGIHPGAYFGRERPVKKAKNRDRIELRSCLDIRDDDERLTLLHRLHWRTMRTSRLAADESADNEPRDLEERMDEMHALGEEQRKAGMLLDDGAPLRLNVSLALAPIAKTENTAKEKTLESVPTEKEALFKGKVIWDGLSDGIIDRNMGPSIKHLMTKHLGVSDDDDLVMFVVEHSKDYEQRLFEGLETPLGAGGRGLPNLQLVYGDKTTRRPPDSFVGAGTRAVQYQLVLNPLASALVSFAFSLVETWEGGSLLGPLDEPLVIFLALLVNATAVIIQETYAQKAIDVLRAGQIAHIHASELVPGDIITVSAGDNIPADCRLLSIPSSTFRVLQVIRTGEGESVSKTTDVVPEITAVKQDVTTLLLSGTTVVNGSTQAIVVSDGQKAAIGDIRKSISSQINKKTPPQRKLDDFGDMLAKIISIICVFVWVINFKNFRDPSHRVAAIPEGLAARRNTRSYERHLSDKTGILTTNQMSVSRVRVNKYTALSISDIFFHIRGNNLKEYPAEGTTFAPHGSVTSLDGQGAEAELRSEPVQRLAQICAVGNDSEVVFNSDRKLYTNVVEPTEAARNALVEKLLSADPVLNQRLSSMSPPKRAPESNLDRRNSVLVPGGEILPMTESLRSNVMDKTLCYASQGLRTLAMAYVDIPDVNSAYHRCQDTNGYARFGRGLAFVALVGMLDPPRPEVRSAVANCRTAGSE